MTWKHLADSCENTCFPVTQGYRAFVSHCCYSPMSLCSIVYLGQVLSLPLEHSTAASLNVSSMQKVASNSKPFSDNARFYAQFQ